MIYYIYFSIFIMIKRRIKIGNFYYDKKKNKNWKFLILTIYCIYEFL